MRNLTLSSQITMVRLLGAAALTLSATAHAGVTTCGLGGTSCTVPTTTTTPAGNRNTTQAFAGVNWTFGVGPDLVAGVRYTRTDGRQRVTGARLEAVFPFNTAFTKINFDRLRLRLIGGNRSGMYELGGGYSFSGQGFLASAAVQAEHISLGTDLIFGGMQWLPYVGFDTLTKPKRTVSGNGTATTCPSGFTLTNVAAIVPSTFNSVNAADQTNGQTCYRPASGV